MSTIIPAFNAERFLPEAIESTLAQGYPNLEVIVVDDGSTDGTAAVAASHEEVRLIRQPNAGPAAARNAAIEVSAGDLIALLDADDMMAPGRLEAQVAFLERHPGVAGVLGRAQIVVEPGVEPPRWALDPRAAHDRTPEPTEFPPELPLHPLFPAASLVVRRAAFDRVGPYDETFRFSEDVDWMFRAWEAGLVFETIDQVVIYRRVHGGNVTYDAAAVRLSAFRTLKARIDRRRRRASSPDPR